MANVTKQVRLYVSRHRRRRGDSPVQFVYAPYTNVVTGTYHDEATHSVPYDFGAGEVDCPFLFWAVQDPSGGHVQTARHLDEPVTGETVVTAWYAPAGGVGNGGPGVYIDAFDDTVGDFVDDDFVDVISDPTLTASANLDGWLPTTVAEKARARTSISSHTGDPFDQWILDTADVTAATTELDAAVKGSGFAFANYKQPAGVVLPPVHEPGSWIDILIGIINDGPGLYLGPDGKVHPWPGPEPFYRELTAAMAVYGKAAALPGRERLQAQRFAAQAMVTAGQEALKAAEAGVPAQQQQVNLEEQAKQTTR